MTKKLFRTTYIIIEMIQKYQEMVQKCLKTVEKLQ